MKLVHKNPEIPVEDGDWLSRAKNLEQGGELHKAAAAFEKVIKANPLNEYQHLLLGLQKLEGKDAQGALMEFREALRLDPNRIEARDGLIRAIKAKYGIYNLYSRVAEWRDKTGSAQMSVVDAFFWFAIMAGLFAAVNPPGPLELYLQIGLFLIMTPIVALLIVDPIANLLLSMDTYGRHAFDQRQLWVTRTTAAGVIIALLGIVVMVPAFNSGFAIMIVGLETIAMFGGVYHKTVAKHTAAIITSAIVISITTFAAARVVLYFDDLIFVGMMGLTALAISYFMTKRAA